MDEKKNNEINLSNIKIQIGDLYSGFFINLAYALPSDWLKFISYEFIAKFLFGIIIGEGEKNSKSNLFHFFHNIMRKYIWMLFYLEYQLFCFCLTLSHTHTHAHTHSPISLTFSLSLSLPPILFLPLSLSLRHSGQRCDCMCVWLSGRTRGRDCMYAS